MTNLHLRLERAKKIQHVMERLGVPEDGRYITEEGLTRLETGSAYFVQTETPVITPTWRLDKCLNVLPDWCFDLGHNLYEQLVETHFKTEDFDVIYDSIRSALIQFRQPSRGQEALDAVSELICLLDENGLLEEKK